MDQSEVYWDSLAEKGTDCRRDVEVFATSEEVEQRDDYLGSFVGAMVRPGYHNVVGTVVERTSDEITASQQNEIEANVIMALTYLGE